MLTPGIASTLSEQHIFIKITTNGHSQITENKIADRLGNDGVYLMKY